MFPVCAAITASIASKASLSITAAPAGPALQQPADRGKQGRVPQVVAAL